MGTRTHGNGLGSTWQEKGKKWRWEVVLGYRQVGLNADGTPHMKRLTKGGRCSSKLEAQKKLAQAVSDHSRGTLAEPDKVTVGEWVQRWLEQHTPRWAATTRAGHETGIQRYILPELGHIRLQALKNTHLKSFYAGMAKKVGPATQRRVHSILHSALNEAERDDLITRNPARVVKPAQARAVKVNIKEVWTGEELTRFLMVVRPTRWGALLEFILATGVRRGEACGLRWENVNLEKSRAYIVESLVRVKGKVEVSTPKTQKSVRALVLAPQLVTLLEGHRAEQEANKRTAQAERLPWKETGYVFANTQGGPLRPDNIKRYKDRFCEEAGVKRIRIHDMRHTYASLMLRKRVPLEVVSEMLGHSRPSFTADVYRSIYDDERETYALDINTLTGQTVTGKA